MNDVDNQIKYVERGSKRCRLKPQKWRMLWFFLLGRGLQREEREREREIYVRERLESEEGSYSVIRNYGNQILT